MPYRWLFLERDFLLDFKHEVLYIGRQICNIPNLTNLYHSLIEYSKYFWRFSSSDESVLKIDFVLGLSQKENCSTTLEEHDKQKKLAKQINHNFLNLEKFPRTVVIVLLPRNEGFMKTYKNRPRRISKITRKRFYERKTL